MIKIKNANFVCTMKHVKLQNFDPEQIEFLARVSEQIGFFLHYIHPWYYIGKTSKMSQPGMYKMFVCCGPGLGTDRYF